MMLQPIIKAKLSRFKTVYELDTESDGIAFERFANQTILKSHQAGGTSIEDELLDIVSVGGYDDMGLDGLAIKINGILIRSLEEAKDIIYLHKKISIEFIFIQSKYKDKFDSGEYSKFINGAIDYLGENHYQPMNKDIKMWLEIKDYLFEEQIMIYWIDNPIIRLYYIVMGEWNNSKHIIAISNKFRDDVKKLNSYGDIFINYVDTEKFKRICDENDNLFTTVVNVIDTFSLTAVKEVDNSSIILCSASELMNLLVTGDGLIRKGLFTDNVRDFQGETSINDDIYKTIKDDPESFVLVNNGVTIICKEIIPGNRKVTIKNPKIVNGCQSCNILYKAFRDEVDISNVIISAKLISTDSEEVTNKIVRGTNRQNIVYDEAFEITRGFHKDLEELFEVLSSEQSDDKIYYERRSKQYSSNLNIKAFQKVNFRMLIQSFVSIFLEEPHKGHRHESKLLEEYKNKIFIDSQSKYPYYLASLIYVKIEYCLKRSSDLKKYKTYKAHIAMIIRIIANNRYFDINNEKNIDSYCDEMKKIIYDNSSFEKILRSAVSKFDDTIEKWTSEKGESYRYGVKDSMEFTKFLKKFISESEGQEVKNRGTVVKIGVDRNGKYFGFISRSPQNIFFHSVENANLNFDKLESRDVLYDVQADSRFMQEKAINVHIIE